VVPDRVVLTVNHRFAPDRSPAEAEAHVRELVGDADDFTVVDVMGGAPPSLDHPLLRALVDRNQLPVRAKLGWTDVARFTTHGVPAANFGPGDPTLAHTADERVDRAALDATAGALRRLLEEGP
jgi:succinyl-diaminopimelate desuccinylase